MPCTISTSEDQAFIILKVTGEINRRLAMIYDVEAHRLGKELGIHCYLMDLTESVNTDSVLDSYEFSYQDLNASVEINQAARVALLVSPEDHSHDFIETLSRNAGRDVLLFRQRQLAEDYLRSD